MRIVLVFRRYPQNALGLAGQRRLVAHENLGGGKRACKFLANGYGLLCSDRLRLGCRFISRPGIANALHRWPR